MNKYDFPLYLLIFWRRQQRRPNNSANLVRPLGHHAQGMESHSGASLTSTIAHLFGRISISTVFLDSNPIIPVDVPALAATLVSIVACLET